MEFEVTMRVKAAADLMYHTDTASDCINVIKDIMSDVMYDALDVTVLSLEVEGIKE